MLQRVPTLKLAIQQEATPIYRSDSWRGMLLSPRSYKATSTNKTRSLPGLGCCVACYSGLGSPAPNKAGVAPCSTAVLPKYAIANGWCIGTPPRVLSELNEVELAIVSPARINKHVFAFQAGNHRTIKGWHSLYYNDLSHFEAVEEHVREIVTAPTISVVLVGPFTPAQKTATLRRTTVSWHKVNRAIEWLKLHNHLYHGFVAPDRAHVQPIIVDERYAEFAFLVRYCTLLLVCVMFADVDPILIVQ